MPCSHGYRSPRELYEKAIECRDGIFTIFGKTAAELLKAIEFYDYCYGQPMKHEQNYCELCKQQQEKTKMTRDEATKILQTCKYSFIDTLEALGLLKFNEPSKLEMVEWHCEGIIHRYPKGYDPNHSSGLIWIKVADKSEFLTIPVGTHTHTVALETIIKALNAKGYETIKSDKIRSVDYKDGTRIIYERN